MQLTRYVIIQSRNTGLYLHCMYKYKYIYILSFSQWLYFVHSLQRLKINIKRCKKKLHQENFVGKP